MKKHAINPDQCTACTMCVAQCPVTAATRKFRGPKLTGPALDRMRKFVQDDDAMLDYCSNCKNCDLTCPSGVPISTLNMLARAAYYKTHKRKSRADDMLAHGERMGKLVSSLPLGATFMNLGMMLGKTMGVMEPLGIAGQAPMPAYADESFFAKFKKIKQTPCARKIVFFPGCFINYNQPEVGVDLVKVYQANRIEVIVDEQFVCCGSPLVSGGYLDEARENAAKNTGLIKKWIDKGYDVVTACTSCGLMLRQEYQELFDDAQIAANAGHVYDAMEYLDLLQEKGQFDQTFAAIDEKFIYHAPCHLKVQGFGKPTLDLLSLIPGLTIEEADAGCCGMSGSYGFKSDKYEIAMKIGAPLFEKIKQSGAGQGVSECGICRLQMKHGSGVDAVHPLTILRRAYEAAK